MKPLWKVKGFEKQTLWKVSVLSFLPHLVVSSLSSFSLFFLALSLSVFVSRCVGVVFGVWVCDTLKNRVSVQNASVCTFKTSPCIRAPCAHGGRFERATPHRTHTQRPQPQTPTRRQKQSCRLLALVLNNFDIQSTARESHCHGYSCRLPVLVSTTLTFRADVAKVSPVVHPRLF